MRIPDHPTLLRRMIDSRLKKLATTPTVLAATLSTYTHRCGRPACRCHHGGRSFSITVDFGAADRDAFS